MVVKVSEYAVAHHVMELIPVGGREMGGLVELDRALGILAEHAADDTDVEVETEMSVQAHGKLPYTP